MEKLAEDVIDMALAMDMWVFGGYVRDVIVRGQTKFGDVDLCCSEKKTNVAQFIRMLGTRFKVTEVRTRKIGTVARYGRMSRGIKRVERCTIDDLLHVDIVVFDGSFNEWCDEESVDFTSNIFFKSWDTKLGIRYAPGRFKHMANPVDEIVKMTREGVVERIWDATAEHTNHWHVFQICNRARDLVKRGFTFKGTLLSPLMEIKLLDRSYVHDMCLEIEQIIEDYQARRGTREMIRCLTRKNIHLPEEIFNQIEGEMVS